MFGPDPSPSAGLETAMDEEGGGGKGQGSKGLLKGGPGPQSRQHSLRRFNVFWSVERYLAAIKLALQRENGGVRDYKVSAASLSLKQGGIRAPHQRLKLSFA
jgi:hypothetical protein